ncbi:LysE family translocator [Kiloniella laminariae]|uniref:LysE family translocator n=1 Tax=Kiloniella laminariae TaxID=454162 RepID=A0ABT4LQ67_9PROT|nr:LysE family translocator [Kiloniella laminariae]MCZ4282466.1 LysE family translocator [Kiloniella laminariae]
MGITEILSFVLVASLLVISPGPNGVLIAKTVPLSGKGAGFANIGGFVAAFYLHGLLSVLGISVLLVKSAELFTLVKIVGAIYLIWLGVKALRQSLQKKGSLVAPAIKPATRRRTLVTALLEGFLTNVLNPKVSMFYLAAFPQFITPGEAAIGNSLLLVSLHALINAVWFTGMIVFLARLSGAARNESFQRWLKGITGVVFIGFGARLAMMKP